MNRLCKALPCLFLLLGTTACAGSGGVDDLGDLGDNDVPWLVPDVPAEVAPDVPVPAGSAALVVRVFKGVGQPLADATVTLGTLQGTTSFDGVVRLEGLEPGRVQARVTADGYAPSTATADLLDGLESTTSVFLLERGPRLPFQVAEGALLFRSGVRVDLPPDSVVDAAGKAVEGEIEATVTPLDPTSGQLLFAPGPFEGIPEGGGDKVLLESVLMADVSLWRGDEKLQLAPGAQATLTFALPYAVRERLAEGERIPLWWFDTDAGLWRQEGDTVVETGEGDVKAGVAKVAHFTWWNMDAPVQQRNCVIVTATESGTGKPTPGVQVLVYTDAERGYGYGWTGYSSGTTNAQGEACLDFPLGAKVEVAILGGGGDPGGLSTTVQASGEWSSCKVDVTKCTRAGVRDCATDGECADGNPCTRDECPEGGSCSHAPFPWAGGRCEVPGRLVPGTWSCDPRRCQEDRPCGEDELRICLPDLVLDQPVDEGAVILGRPIRVAGHTGCGNSLLQVTATSPGGASAVQVGSAQGLDGEFDFWVLPNPEVLSARPGRWTFRFRETGLGNCFHEVVRTLVVPEAPLVAGGFKVTALDQAAPGGLWFRVVYAYVPVGCPGALVVAGADAPALPRVLLGTDGMPAWNDIALVNGTPRGDGTGPTAYAKGSAGYESPVGNGTVPRACLAVDATTRTPRIELSTGRDVTTGAGLFPGDSDVVCGGPLLLRDAQDVVEAQIAAEGFDRAALHADDPWARSAACVVKDGGVVLVGARAASGAVGTDVGFTLSQLAAFLKSLGCNDAMVLDGGAPVFFDADYPQYQQQEIPALYNTLAGMDRPTCSPPPVP